MTFVVKHARPDGSFVVDIELPGRGVLPYHVVQSDPLFTAVAAAAEGADLEPEPALPPAPPNRRITALAFMDRLSAQRQVAVAGAALASPAVMLWLLRLTAAAFVDLDASETAAGVAALLSAGAITGDEAVALLA